MGKINAKIGKVKAENQSRKRQFSKDDEIDLVGLKVE